MGPPMVTTGGSEERPWGRGLRRKGRDYAHPKRQGHGGTRRALDETEDEVAFRLVPSPEGYRMHLDSPSDEDRTIEDEDRVVLMVAAEVDEQLTGAVLDVEDGEHPRLMLRLAGTP